MFELFKKFRSKVKKTSTKLFDIIDGIFSKGLDQNTIEALEEAMYSADFGVDTTGEILARIKEAYKTDKQLKGQSVIDIASSVLKKIMAGADVDVDFPDVPTVICLVGVNGSGKTTTAAKLANKFSNEGKSVLVGACDTFRAAANEQIKEWSKKLGFDLIGSQHGADSASVAFDTYEAAIARKKNVVILDTAGRLHNKDSLMVELDKLKRVLGKKNAAAPHHSWLVLDAGVGVNSLASAKKFHEAFGLTGIIITKLDGTSKAGAAVGIYKELGLPINFVGLGEGPDDIHRFSVDWYIDLLFSR
ncbi:MAG: signal recognition particle-docking protein FtsY [Puniceicoccales bacterium]|nr:signal recognition particle-docking protein FtsY [Puniceicoccales bacterium]